MTFDQKLPTHKCSIYKHSAEKCPSQSTNSLLYQPHNLRQTSGHTRKNTHNQIWLPKFYIFYFEVTIQEALAGAQQQIVRL